MATKFDPKNAQNLMEAVEQAQTYWNLLAKVPPRELKLTALDDDIFKETQDKFPELFENEYAGLIKLDENFMKSEDGKKRWFAFHTLYVTSPYLSIDFYAFEVARNRLGLNEKAHEIAKADAAKEAEKKEKEAKAAQKKKARK
ncbi:hypothetical protein H0H92_007356 [Tricholoma furcatifolium]|nr:hypothetical protein H0H92_007356 [Tricholoma furcatifolium]